MKVMMALTIQRAILEELRRDIRREEIAFLIGPRQAGKTTIMKIVQGELEAAGERTLFLSLDFDSDRVYFESQQNLLKKIRLEFGDSPGFVFIDEIQRREDAGFFLKGLQDLGLPYKFIVSGSGSVDLKAKIKESMVGRKRVYEVYPLSLTEFVNFRTGYRYADRLPDFFALETARSADLLAEYLNLVIYFTQVDIGHPAGANLSSQFVMGGELAALCTMRQNFLPTDLLVRRLKRNTYSSR